MTKLIALLLVSSAAIGCADGDYSYTPGPDRAALGAKPDSDRTVYQSSYTCTGGTGDVSFAVEADAKAIYAQNTEAGARFIAKSSSHDLYKLSADANDEYTDVGLMGSRATVSKSAFADDDTVALVLEGGESAGTYSCTLDPAS